MIDPEDDTQTSIIERTADYKPPRSLRAWLIGRPLQTADAPHETIGKAVGLAVFASDALSSTAYATQEILVILAAAGTLAFGYVFPIAMVIVGLLAIVTFSYVQIIHTYPDGGGAYVVARDNLGQVAALIAAASLLIDYILTVSVSISSGVAQIVSAFPQLFANRVPLAIGLVFIVMFINLRGVRESGAAFASLNYFFIIMMSFMVGSGLLRYYLGTLGVVGNLPHSDYLTGVAAITPFLLLHAFASGTAALTGVEAISNGITAFKQPRSRNAAITLVWMACILATLFLAISFLTSRIGALPSEQETVISQLARTIFPEGSLLYILSIAATTVILVIAANTAFAGFPRLSALAAKDGYLPRQLTYRGSRLVYSRGIVALALIASLLIVIFQASVTRLIPLYAIGVFMSFTLSQAGMARRWWKTGRLKPGQTVVERGSELHYEKNWFFKMTVNGVGALCTAVVMVVFSVTKFHDGAYVVLLLIPVLVWIFLLIHRHYARLARELSLDNFGVIPPHTIRHRVVMPISNVHQGTLAALRYARMLSDDVTAIHVSIDPVESDKVRKKWEKWGEGVRMLILDSPYRLFLEPLLDYIADLEDHRQPGETITIVVPEFVSRNRLSATLHTNTANLLRSQLRNQPGIVITNVPYQVSESDSELGEI
ncbi:MAG TPA: APC family permease [Anaerolineales bacterium]